MTVWRLTKHYKCASSIRQWARNRVNTFAKPLQNLRKTFRMTAESGEYLAGIHSKSGGFLPADNPGTGCKSAAGLLLQLLLPRSGMNLSQIPRRQVNVMVPSFQAARIFPLYWVQMLSAMERPIPKPSFSLFVLREESSR